MKKFFLTAATAAMLVLVLGICSCSSDTSPSVTGTYIGTSTPAVGSVTADTTVITPGVSSSQINVQRGFNFSGSESYFFIPGTVSSTSISIPAYTLSTGLVYSATGTISGSTLTLYESVSYNGATPNTSKFSGTKR